MPIPKERLGVLFILVGPGGVGKNALLNQVVNDFDNLRQLPTATTRDIRPGEQQGREHVFVSSREFEKMIDEDALLEYQEVHPGKFYGVPRETVNNAIDTAEDLIADIEVYGAAVIRQEYPDNSVTIFIAPPSIAELADRLKNRDASAKDIEDRVNRLPMEMQHAPQATHIIVNDDIATAAAELRDIIQAERDSTGGYTPLNRVSFNVRVTPVYGDEMLIRKAGGAPEAVLSRGERPDAVAAQVVRESLGITPQTDRLVYATPEGDVPVDCDYNATAHTYQLNYHYVYRLPARRTPPEGWHYEKVKK